MVEVDNCTLRELLSEATILEKWERSQTPHIIHQALDLFPASTEWKGKEGHSRIVQLAGDAETEVHFFQSPNLKYLFRLCVQKAQSFMEPLKSTL